jgi:hypothetical protein
MSPENMGGIEAQGDISGTNSREADKRHEVRIHIDRETYRSPNRTTGKALYALAHVPTDEKLFREVQGDHEDESIPYDEREIHLKIDDHFYSRL